MSLRVALLLIGLAFIAVIAFTARRRKTHHNPHSITEIREEPSLHVPKAYHPLRENEAELTPGSASGQHPDINDTANETRAPSPGLSKEKPVFDINAHYNDFSPEPPDQLDENLDHVAYIKSGKPVSWTILNKLALPILADVEEPLELVGQSTFGKTWYTVTDHREIGNFGNLALRMPLLNRKRRPAARDFNQLDVAAETIAEAIGRRVTLPAGSVAPQSRAEALANFYHDYKFLLYVHILAKPGAAFQGKDLRRLFVREKLQYEAGFFHKLAAGNGKEINFSVADLYEPGKFDNKKLKKLSTGGLTLFFSVPLVKRPSRVFTDMLKMADVLATGLEGQMHDPDFNEVSMDMLEATSDELKQLENVMQEFGIAAGSDTAKRLFRH